MPLAISAAASVFPFPGEEIMSKKQRTGQRPDGWKALFRTIKNLKLPWIWIIVGLSLNLYLNDLMLKIPDMTSDLLSGQLTGSAMTSAVMYYVIFGILSCVMVAGQVQAQTYGIKRARNAIWKKMLGMKMEYFDRNDPSDLMSTIINDTGTAINDFINILIYLIPDIYYVVRALFRINQYHWILTVSCFAMIPLKYLYALFMGKQFQKHTAKLYVKIGELTGFLADRINHLPLIKTYTNETKEGENGEEAAGKILKANMKLVQLDNIANGIVSVIDILQKFVVVVVAVILLQKKEIDMAMWIAFFLFAQNLFPTMDNIFDIWTKIKGMHGSFHRIIEVMDGESEESSAAESFPETGDIKFENVTFTYPGTDAPALKNVSFTVPRGSCVAIVGLCGSGKTTSVSMLERFYTPDGGRILIGDTDIKDIPLTDFRKNLAYVQQGAEIFSGTLREALTYGIDREIDDKEIYEAAERTGFSEYLALCKDGLETEVQSGGTSMSGGQSQRLVLTRELLRGGNIIIMDEPTSALDVRISAKVQDTMDELFADKTRILITHDLSFAKRYGRIIVMENGIRVGDGTHEELLENCDTYKKMNENAEEQKDEE